MEVPYLNSWVENAFKYLVIGSLVKQMTSISHQDFSALEKVEPPILVDFGNNVRQEDIVRHSIEVEKSRKDGGKIYMCIY